VDPDPKWIIIYFGSGSSRTNNDGLGPGTPKKIMTKEAKTNGSQATNRFGIVSDLLRSWNQKPKPVWQQYFLDKGLYLELKHLESGHIDFFPIAKTVFFRKLQYMDMKNTGFVGIQEKLEDPDLISQ